MDRATATWLGVAVIGAATLAALSHRGATEFVPGKPGSGWRDADAPRRIRAIAAPVEQIANWPGLGNYLASIAWIESRGNPRAGKDTGNAARGWFGIRPRSARVEDLGLPPSALKDERYAVALAAWYAHRCRKYAGPGQVLDWLAIRRCWTYPSITSDVDSSRARSNLTKGIAKAGLPQEFMFAEAFPPGYQWPGIDAVLAAVGRGATA